jgi:hypothetical protein
MDDWGAVGGRGQGDLEDRDGGGVGKALICGPPPELDLTKAYTLNGPGPPSFRRLEKVQRRKVKARAGGVLF